MIKKPEFTLTIPNWKNKVCIGIVGPKYYKASNKTPKTISSKYKVKNVMRDYYYVDEKGAPVVKNKKNVGKEEMWAINGQSFYQAALHWKTRTKIVNEYHAYLTNFIKKEFSDPFPTYLNFSLSMHIDIYEIYTSHLPDITNMWILPKLIEDCFVNSKILKEDSPEFRMKTSYEYKFVNKKADRKLVVTFKYKER